MEALKIASGKHDLLRYVSSLCQTVFDTLSSLSDSETYLFNITPAEKQEFVDEVNTELSVYFGMLYFLIEMFKGDEDFAEELSEHTYMNVLPQP